MRNGRGLTRMLEMLHHAHIARRLHHPHQQPAATESVLHRRELSQAELDSLQSQTGETDDTGFMPGGRI